MTMMLVIVRMACSMMRTALMRLLDTHTTREEAGLGVRGGWRGWREEGVRMMGDQGVENERTEEESTQR
jgi:hypothetical protein